MGVVRRRISSIFIALHCKILNCNCSGSRNPYSICHGKSLTKRIHILHFFLNRAANRQLPGRVLLCRADKRCLIILFLYHADDMDSKQDFLLLCHSLSYPFCIDTPSQLRYFSIRFTRNFCFSGDRLELLFLVRTCRQRKLRQHGYRYMGRRIIEGCL
jgi:hypothetical protein